MYRVCYEVMCMPVIMHFESKEDAEKMKKEVEKKLPGVKVEIK